MCYSGEAFWTLGLHRKLEIHRILQRPVNYDAYALGAYMR